METRGHQGSLQRCHSPFNCIYCSLYLPFFSLPSFLFFFSSFLLFFFSSFLLFFFSSFLLFLFSCFLLLFFSLCFLSFTLTKIKWHQESLQGDHSPFIVFHPPSFFFFFFFSFSFFPSAFIIYKFNPHTLRVGHVLIH
jgi:hypothetical protein